MVRVISQETFDSVVKENEEDLGMDHEEAVKDAIKQFEAQGVDLSNVVTSGSTQAVEQVTRDLAALLQTPALEDLSALRSLLATLKSECDLDIARKVLAGKQGAYSLLVEVLERYPGEHEAALLSLACVTSLMTGQPDLLDERGVEAMVRGLNHESEPLKQHTLRWARQCCLKHEANRQLIMESQLGTVLTSQLGGASAPLVRLTCCVMRALVLDDDIRVPYGKAHEHARLLACDHGGLQTIARLLHSHKDDLETVNELLSTLAALVVREEFCREVEECGGVAIIMDTMITYPDDEKLNRQCLKLLKGLAGSDAVKGRIVQAGAVPLIISAMARHQSSVALFNFGCLAVAAIALRSPANSELLCHSGAAEAILQGMREHAKDVNTQKACSLAIRNVVSRNRELSKEFLEAGAEELLRSAMQEHGAKCESNARDALRDLGCEVQLKERWTGKNTGVTH